MGAPMEEKDDPLALIVASLGEAAKTSAAAHTAADAAHQAALETQLQLYERISGLETAVATLAKQSRDREAGLAQKVDALTATLKGMKGSFSERYAWGSAGILLGISFCVTMLYRLATANLPR